MTVHILKRNDARPGIIIAAIEAIIQEGGDVDEPSRLPSLGSMKEENRTEIIRCSCELPEDIEDGVSHMLRCDTDTLFHLF